MLERTIYGIFDAAINPKGQELLFLPNQDIHIWHNQEWLTVEEIMAMREAYSKSESFGPRRKCTVTFTDAAFESIFKAPIPWHNDLSGYFGVDFRGRYQTTIRHPDTNQELEFPFPVHYVGSDYSRGRFLVGLRGGWLTEECMIPKEAHATIERTSTILTRVDILDDFS